MPGIEYEDREVAESPVLGTLKAHKVLPRERAATNGEAAARSKRRENAFERGKRGSKAHNTLNVRPKTSKWSSDGVEAIPLIGQPPTPPMPFRDNFKSWLNDKALRDGLNRSQDAASTDPLFPLDQNLPTPATTPPVQHMSNSSNAKSLQLSHINFRDQTPNLSTTNESRTDSFKTAQENLSSDEADLQSESPSLRPARKQWLRDTGLSSQGGLGLDLGLDQDDVKSSARVAPPPKVSQRETNEFVSFDGNWGSQDLNGRDDVESQGTVRHKSEEEIFTGDENVTENPDLRSSETEKSMIHSKQDVWRRGHKRQRSSKEAKIKSADGTRREDGMHDGLGDPFNVNEKRMSQASTTSTIVEAMVIESPPQRRQTLRHTGKMVKVNIGQKFAESSPTRADERPLKHRSRKFVTLDGGAYGTFHSNMQRGAALAEDLTRGKGQPVDDALDRHTSIQPSSRSIKRISRAISSNPNHLPARPITAPEDTVGYFDFTQRDRRTTSMMARQVISNKDQRYIENQSSSPPTSLSPAALASKELSRATSINSGGLRTHYVPPSPNSQCPSTPLVFDSHDGQYTAAERSGSGDWPVARPRSSMVTPFSLRSAQSSTPGTLEVNEATAVNIYPHTNKSILVIQETASRGDSSPGEQPTVRASNTSIAVPTTNYPVLCQPTPPDSDLLSQAIDSPLQNPRDPPQPPEFKLIPPTPANFSSSSDTVWNHKRLKRQNRFSAPLTSLKRAISARRYSESVAIPFTRSRSLRSTSAQRRRPSTFEELDSKLHPFWRPRTFWGGESDSDSDSEFGNEGILSPQRRPSSHSSAKNSAVPQRTMSLTRRLTGSLRSSALRHPRPILSAEPYPDDNDHNPSSYHRRDLSDPTPARRRRSSFSLSRTVGGSLRLPLTQRPRRETTANWHNQPDYEFIQPEDRDKGISMHGYGHNEAQLAGLRSLADRFERRRESREEGKREERRNWLRGRIGLVGPREVKGFDMVYPPPAVAAATAVMES